MFFVNRLLLEFAAQMMCSHFQREWRLECCLWSVLAPRCISLICWRRGNYLLWACKTSSRLLVALANAVLQKAARAPGDRRTPEPASVSARRIIEMLAQQSLYCWSRWSLFLWGCINQSTDPPASYICIQLALLCECACLHQHRKLAIIIAEKSRCIQFTRTMREQRCWQVSQGMHLIVNERGMLWCIPSLQNFCQ